MERQDLESGKKLVSDSSLSNSKDIEVKFIPPDPRNGDAKIDIENLKCVFTGMGKEELMKYADDPFWVRIRWFLFILFWLIWVAMLVGAISIIVIAPKCMSAPRPWWELSPIYKVDVKTAGNLKGIETKLDAYKKLGVENLLLTSVLKSSSKVEADDFIEDFKSVDPAVGSDEDFVALIEKAKNKDLKVQLSFVPVHSSDKHEFFQNSIKKKDPHTNFYVWQPNNKAGAPNHWMSKNGGSAWSLNEERNEYYLHWFSVNQPVFNFHSSNVVEYFKDVFKGWLNKGVSGIYLDKVEYMFGDLESSNRTTETDISGGSSLLTLKSSELVNILELWNSTVVSNCSGCKVLTVDGLTSKTGSSVVLNSQPPTLNSTVSAANLMEVVKSYLPTSSSWPVWQFLCAKNPDPKMCWSSDLINGLQLVAMLLPGTPVINDGEELNVGSVRSMPGTSTSASETPAPTSVSDGSAQLTNVDKSPQLFKKLVEARHSPAFEHGEFEVKVLRDVVFAFTRIKSGSPGYLVAFNPTEAAVDVNLSELKSVPEELTVEIWLRPQTQVSSPLKGKLDSRVVTIPPNNTIFCSFVPQI